MQSNKVQAVIFDLSGTVIDFGSRGPVVAFVELFARHGVAVTEQEARVPMGAHKRDHIWAMLNDPSIRRRWMDRHGSEPDAALLDRLYPEFTALQVEVLARHSEVLPGVPEMTAELRRRGIRFSSTTGFDVAMMEGLIRSATANGYNPDIFVCPDMVGGGRPAPWMAFHAARTMGVYPMSTVVKAGDTPVDIAEAKNAGMWAVSVVATGNEIGLSAEQLAALSAGEREARFRAAREKFLALGADYVIDASADLLPVIEAIDARLAAGERP
jgi:phosphonoacetaldehyde hydrolase